MGGRFDQNVLNIIADDLVNNKLARYSPQNIKAVVREIDGLRKIKRPGGPIFTDIEGVMGRLSELTNSSDQMTAKAAGIANRGIQDFLGNLQPGYFTAANPNAARQLPQLIQSFRKNYAIGSTAEELAAIQRDAEIASHSLLTRKKDIGEELSKQATKMLQHPERSPQRYWPPGTPERRALEEAQHGTWLSRQAARIGSLAPELPGEEGSAISMPGLIKGAVYTTGGIFGSPASAAAAAAATKAAQSWAHAAPIRSWEKLGSLVRAGAPAAKQASTVATPPWQPWRSPVTGAAANAAAELAHKLAGGTGTSQN
jgi:hypothetical protein